MLFDIEKLTDSESHSLLVALIERHYGNWCDKEIILKSGGNCIVLTIPAKQDSQNETMDCRNSGENQ